MNPDGTKSMRVFLIDAESELPTALGSLRAAGELDLVGSIPTLAGAEARLREVRPHVVLVDVLLPLKAQRDLMQTVSSELPNTHFVALSTNDPPDDRVLFAMRSGALGFVGRDETALELAEAIATIGAGEPWLPNRAGSQVLRRAAQRLELTPGERTNRMGQVALAAIPIGAVLGAALGFLISDYWAVIGVRTEDLGQHAEDRLVDVVFLLLLLIGASGPLMFVPTWTRAIRGRLSSRGTSARQLPAPLIAGVLAVLVLAIVATLLVVRPGILAFVVGPFVAVVVLANVIGFSDQLPPILGLEWADARRAALCAVCLAAALVLVLGFELSRGPDIRADGLHGFLAPDVMGDDVVPVRLTGTGDEPYMLEAVLLGAVSSRYVLYDPCAKVVVHVPSNAVTADVIDEVPC
jgi:DNA-binding NarL/FixJ family response regulator